MKISFLALVGSASALQLPPTVLRRPLRPLSPPPLSPPLQPAAALAALAAAVPQSALAIDWDVFWYEMNNEPPISLNPFKVYPIGWFFLALYLGSVSWTAFSPPSEAEKEWTAKVNEEADAAAAAAPAFLAEAAEAEGAVVQPSGLVFQPLAEGSGEAPTTSHVVKVHYKGTLFDGTVFDSSYDRGEPAEFKLGQVIIGWQEGLALMKPGGKAVLTIPADRAYGDMAAGKIPGKSALKFEVELLESWEKKGLFG